MRKTRRLVLLAILVILGGVGFTYYARKTLEDQNAPAPPPRLPDNISAANRDWVYRQDDGKRHVVEIRARDFKSVDKPARHAELDHVELRVFHKDGKTFDKVTSEHAVFDEAQGALYSDGEVEITLAVPSEGSPQGRLLSIKTSGVHFDPTGKASTDRKAAFSFDLGEGEATGATYDPATRELELTSAVKLLWKGKKSGQLPMQVEGERLRYSEQDSKVYLSPKSKLIRGGLTLESADSVISINNGNINLVEAKSARGVDKTKGRELAFGADDMRMEFDEHSQVKKIIGTGNARLDNTSSSGRSETRTDKIDLDFAISENDSILTNALASGHTQVKLNNRVLKSEVVALKMRPNGEEIESLDTQSPGTLDLLAAKPGQPDRFLQAERMHLEFADHNRLSRFTGHQVSTRTVRPPTPQNKQPPPATSSSREMTAAFDLESGQATNIDQTGLFRYKEGDRQAMADRASLDQTANKMRLEKGARVWDAGGSVAADTIDMNQQSGDFIASGNVTSTRMSDKKSSSGGMLAQDEPMQAKAARMTSSNDNTRIVYEGGAVLWQSANRLEADKVSLNRSDKNLHAEGNVVTHMVDKPSKKTKQRQTTIVRAPTLDYKDTERLATYLGGVTLKRPGVDVTSKELRAYLSDDKDPTKDSSLDKAIADGDVVIDTVKADRKRRATSQHAEFYTTEGKILLTGGPPNAVDSKGNTITARRLTYLIDNDSFEADGEVKNTMIRK